MLHSEDAKSNASSSDLMDKSPATGLDAEKELIYHDIEAVSMPEMTSESGLPGEKKDVEKLATSDIKQAGPPPSAFDPRENPDGGLQAWLVVVGGFCCLFCSFGWINCKSSPQHAALFQAYLS